MRTLFVLCLSLLGCQRPEPPKPPPPPPPVVIDTLPPPVLELANCRDERTPFTSIVTVCDRYPPSRFARALRRYGPFVLLAVVVGLIAGDDDDRPAPGRKKHKHHGHDGEHDDG